MVLHLDVDVYVDGAVIGHQPMDGLQAQPQFRQVVVSTERVGVGQLARRADRIGAVGIDQELVVGGEGRVYVDEVNLDARLGKAFQALQVVSRVKQVLHPALP